MAGAVRWIGIVATVIAVSLLALAWGTNLIDPWVASDVNAFFLSVGMLLGAGLGALYVSRY